MPPAPATSSEIRTVLVTGANGYLGRFLCLEWLERMARLGWTARLYRAWRRMQQRRGNASSTRSTAATQN